MLELNDQQLAALDELEKRQYVQQVHQSLINDHPELAADPTLLPRLQTAYQRAVALGFTEGGAITQFLHYEAFAPGFYKNPAIDAWLRKPGRPVEQRWSDLIEVMQAKTREM